MMKINFSKDHTQVNKWATDCLMAKGYSIQNSPEILLEMPWSNIIKYNTDRGYIYLKQTPAELFLEPQVIKMLHDSYNAAAPKIIDVNEKLKCFLMKDAGTKLREVLSKSFNIDLIISAIKEYVYIQNSCISDVKKLLDSGISDWRVNKLPSLYLELINKSDTLISDGISNQELENLNDLYAEVKLTCELIKQYSIPETLNMHDFHDGNILIDKDNNCTIIDWGECEITHPYLSLISCLKNLKFRYKLNNKDSQRLEEFFFQDGMSLSKESLKNVIELVTKIQPIYRALGFYRVKSCTNLREFDAWEEGHGCLARPLKELIENFRAKVKGK